MADPDGGAAAGGSGAGAGTGSGSGPGPVQLLAPGAVGPGKDAGGPHEPNVFGRGGWRDPNSGESAAGAGRRGPLQLSGRGVVGVQTDGMLAYRTRLWSLSQAVDAIDRSARRLEAMPAPAPTGRLDAMEVLVSRVARLDATITDFAPSLGSAVDLYAAADETAQRGARATTNVAVDAVGGVAARLALLTAAANAPALIAAAAVAFAALPGRTPAEKAAALGAAVQGNPGVVTSPAFDELVRFLGENGDDLALGALGIPPGVLLAARAAGRGGVEDNAHVIMSAGRKLGLFRETGVGVIPVSRTSTTAPLDRATGPKERLLRIPDEGIIRIEKHSAPGEKPRYVVYVPPTQTFSPESTTMPFDLTSNVGGVAGDDAGSLRAVEQAMRHAGITSGDEVQLTGFSQGGLIAGRLAQSPDWNVVGVETWGGPTRNIDYPPGVAGYDVHHSDDPIHALSGYQVDTDRLRVEQQARAHGFAADEKPVPAHQRDSYVDTAIDMQQAASPQLRRELDRIESFTGDYARQSGYRIDSYAYDTYRTPGEDVAPRPGWGADVAPSSPASPIVSGRAEARA
ncbi:hypothetical protein GCM10027515_07680 [Schumannella luteola]|uniref:Alpha/beta hydrolase n=1 Tax=Schumannella luteola TaxID=472059 RepID=A0A852Y8A7_9MICO|nr:hypothetical protein [Schumannella luteola]NYG98102.1 hypothetical protein [Schumannella luteola]TPX01825.1 hypothetical protein FJ656_25905 [Schumannella luteola]